METPSTSQHLPYNLQQALVLTEPSLGATPRFRVVDRKGRHRHQLQGGSLGRGDPHSGWLSGSTVFPMFPSQFRGSFDLFGACQSAVLLDNSGLPSWKVLPLPEPSSASPKTSLRRSQPSGWTTRASSWPEAELEEPSCLALALQGSPRNARSTAHS